MLSIDGSAGGGAVLRVSLGLSIATETPFRITGIRAQRSEPGLKAQHLAAVNAATQCCDADVDGAEMGSDALTFRPGTVTDDRIKVQVPTAGSVGLVLQPLQIAAGAGHDLRVTVDGGATVGKWAPPMPYLQHVGTPMLERIGVSQDITVKQHGFYPKGGALVRASFSGEAQPLDLTDRGEIIEIEGISIATGHLEDAEVAERQRAEARRVLANRYPSKTLDIAEETVHTHSPGSVIVLAAKCQGGVIGADALGEKGKRSEAVGKEAAETLIRQIDAKGAVDEWMADQLLPFLGLAGGRMKIPRITDHIAANRGVVEAFCDRRIAFENQVLKTR